MLHVILIATAIAIQGLATAALIGTILWMLHD